MKKILSISLVYIVFLGFSNGATITLSPYSGELIKDCYNKLSIDIDTHGQDIIGGSINMLFNKKEITINSFVPNTDFNLPIEHKILDGSLKGGLLSMIVNPYTNKRIGLNGKIKYGDILIKNIGDIDTTEIKFYFISTGNTEDRNDIYLLKDGSDILSKPVTNKFIFIEGKCKINPNPKIDENNLLNRTFNYTELIDKNIKIIDEYGNKKTDLTQKLYNNIKYIILLILIVIIVFLLIKGSSRNKNLK